MQKTIIAIGGGNIRTQGTEAIDRAIIRRSGKARPKLLFIPTASSDDEEYWEHVREYFGGYLKCKTEVLFLIREHPSQKEIREKILAADIIYVGGGNTLMMMRLWRRLGVDRLLRRAYATGTVLCGISAGSICWFDSGHSDSMSYYNPKRWKYINVKGLGPIHGIHCPHYDSQTLGVPRRNDFKEMIRRVGGMGIAMENNCAIEFVDGKTYRVLTSKRSAAAYKVYRRRGEVVAEKIKQEEAMMPIEKIMERGKE